MEVDEVAGNLDRDELAIALVVVDGAAHVAAHEVEAGVERGPVADDGAAPAEGPHLGDRRLEPLALAVVEGGGAASQETLGPHRCPPRSATTGSAPAGSSTAPAAEQWVGADHREQPRIDRPGSADRPVAERGRSRRAGRCPSRGGWRPGRGRCPRPARRGRGRGGSRRRPMRSQGARASPSVPVSEMRIGRPVRAWSSKSRSESGRWSGWSGPMGGPPWIHWLVG